MTERTHPSDAASTLLAWLRERSRWRPGAATPVDLLARLLELDVATFDAAFHPGVWGYLEPGEDLIFVRAGLSEAARRFTLAHEIGHAVLHRGGGAATEAALSACQRSDLEPLDDSVDETLSPGQAYSARAAVEREANAFAVALLMPEASFLDTYLTLCAHTRPNGVAGGVTRRVAKRFSVSEDAVLRRLQGLLALENSEKASGVDSQASLSVSGDLDQLAAARLEPPALVMAGPGSGKTSTLVARIAHLIEERGAAPNEILALTFSRKAAGELRERVGGALAGADTPAVPYISTIHRFCFDLLERHGRLIGLPPDIRIASELELYFHVRQVVREAPLRFFSSPLAPDLYVRDIQQAISRAKDDLLSPVEAATMAEEALRDAADDTQRDAAERQVEFALIFERYQRRLSEQRSIDYGDVIALAVRLLTERREIAEEVAARWPYVLVDEYQDINRAMGALLRELVSAGSGLWAVGDADQAIYRFRGADPGIVHRFSETFPGARVISLVRNYRSRRAILEAASAFAAEFSPTIGRLPLEAARAEADARQDTRPAVRIASAETSEDELAGLARTIEEIHQRGRAYRDQAVLLRTRRQVEQTTAGLSARGIPTHTLANALDWEIGKRCIAVVSLLSEPSGAGLIRAGLQAEHAFARDDATALLREARRRRKAPLDVALSASVVAGVSETGRVAMRQLGRILAVMSATPSIATGLGLYYFSFTRIGERLLRDREQNAVDAAALRRLLDLARAFDSWQAAAVDTLDGGADWAGFAEFLRAASVLRLDTLDRMLGQEADAVQVMTAHASKGLEFPVVFLPQVVNRRFPLTGRPALVGRLIHADHSPAEKDEGLSDEASLFYVAMTRARDELILSHARRYGRASYTISPFLSPIQREMGERLAQERWAETAETATEAARAEDDALASAQAIQENARALFNIAELETYQRCPKQYAYRYVDNLWSPASLVSLYSKALRRASDDVARAFIQSRQRRKAFLSHDETLALMEERWRATLEEERANSGEAGAPRNTILEAYYSRQARATVERLWMRFNQRKGETNGPVTLVGEAHGQEVTVNIGELRVRGEVETIVASSDGASGETTTAFTQRATNPRVIVRYRSGRTDTSPTLRDLFSEVVSQSETVENDTGRVVIEHNLATGSVAPVVLSARQRARLTREALEAASGIARGDFHANPDEWRCQRCPFAAACPE